ncbi:MAG: LysR family transcriptional regulator [Caldilineaceae bacterium]|nr:LysR family transcriptional regulator [Caldilineaceae bacterium]
MEVAQLRALAMIRQEGSFTKAAARLHVSQPALSQQIKGLEHELGTPLFVRQGRRIALTPAGEVAVARASQALYQLQQLQHEINELLTLERGQVRIGTSDTICLYLLPRLVQRFRHAYPQIDIHLTNRPSQEVIALLRAGTIDFGIVTLPVQGQGLETSYLCDRQDVAVCAPDYPMEQTSHSATDLPLAELIHYPLLLLEQGTTSRAFLDQLFTQAGVVPHALELGSIEVLKRYAEIQLGLAIVPEMAVQHELATGRLRSFALPWVPARAIGLVTLRDQPQSPAAERFLSLLHESFLDNGS